MRKRENVYLGLKTPDLLEQTGQCVRPEEDAMAFGTERGPWAMERRAGGTGQEDGIGIGGAPLGDEH